MLLSYISELYGKNNLEAAFIDEIIDTLLDLQKEGLPAFFEKDEAKKVWMDGWIDGWMDDSGFTSFLTYFSHISSWKCVCEGKEEQKWFYD